MPSRPTVMISSTARDLPEHRNEVRKGCHRAGFASDQMMENLTAVDKHAVEISLKMVEDADIYLGIFAYRYGFVPDGSDISITEMEYNKAVELCKPRLIFFIHEDHPVTGKDIERGEGSAKLEAFKDRVGKDRAAAFFKSPEDLRGHVVEALIELKKSLEGHQRPDPQDAAKHLHRQTPIPAPPKPYIAHPYTLSQTRDLVGRREELNALTDWVAKPGSPAYGDAIFCFVAIGGMGKSAITWKWFNDIAPQEMPDLAGRLWWSFYESDAHFENFLIRTLCYVAGLTEDDVRNMPWQDREALLLQHLNDKPYLLVLDGLERILLAYNRMDASRLADDEYDEQTANVVARAAGLPASAAQSFSGQHRLRQTTDPRAGQLLRKLAQAQSSRILISTRLYPLPIQLPNAEPCPGSFTHFLKGLSDDDAVTLWRQLGVSGSRQELVPLFKSFECHALLIQALAGEIARDRKSPGDFAAWRKSNPSFNPASLPATQVKSHILQHALAGLNDSMRATLTTIVALRMPATYDTLEALLVGQGKAYCRRQEIDIALAELEDRGLIGWDRDANRYDAHPIVRGVVWQNIGRNSQQKVYSALERLFQAMPIPDVDKVETLSDLTPIVERYHTLLELGRYDDALDLFREHLDYPMRLRLAAVSESATWLERFFPDGVDRSVAPVDETDQGDLIAMLAGTYYHLGQIERSVAMFRGARQFLSDWNEKKRDAAFADFSHALRELGQFREAVKVQRDVLDLSRRFNNRLREGLVLANLSRTVSMAGDLTIGAISFYRSLRILSEHDGIQSIGVLNSNLAERLLWTNMPSQAQIHADRAWEIADNKKFERSFIRSALFQGRAALALNNCELAAERLSHSLVRTRAANIVHFELQILISLAELDLKRSNPASARVHLDQVWEPTKEGPYPLYLADAYNVLADICLAEDDKLGAIEAAINAYRAAWCDGPPWAYHWGMEKAKAHLRSLDASFPDMPPFDESKFEPLPEIEINSKDDYWVDPSEPPEALLDLPQT